MGAPLLSWALLSTPTALRLDLRLFVSTPTALRWDLLLLLFVDTLSLLVGSTLLPVFTVYLSLYIFGPLFFPSKVLSSSLYKADLPFRCVKLFLACFAFFLPLYCYGFNLVTSTSLLLFLVFLCAMNLPMAFGIIYWYIKIARIFIVADFEMPQMQMLCVYFDPGRLSCFYFIWCFLWWSTLTLLGSTFSLIDIDKLIREPENRICCGDRVGGAAVGDGAPRSACCHKRFHWLYIYNIYDEY